MPDRKLIDRTRKILIIKLFAIGELLMATPLIASLKETFPEASLHVLTGSYIKDVIKNNPHVDKVIAADEKDFLAHRAVPLSRLLLALRREKYDMIFCLHRPFIMSLFTFLARAPVRAGFERGREGFLYTHRVKPNIPGRHQIEEYLDLLRALGVEPSFTKKMLFLDEEALARKELIFREHGLEPGKKVVALSPAGGNNLAAHRLGTDALVRRWPDEKYGRLAKLVIEKLGAKVLIVGGEAEKAAAGKIIEIAGPECIDLTGKTDILTASAVIKGADILVTNDSGPMHLAASVGTFVIALFGPTDPNVAGPYCENSQVIRKGFLCSPCFSKDRFPPFNVDCPAWKCMEEIDPAEVYREIENHLKASCQP
ncbi:MAG: lipopolysaccharide heptosyltransferase II [Candidatus Eremiobacteraeota bacterium]|nr:lipopolysaccharide heptosyltransferase II [Candidatus Eremiobacteraeota bacterium]